MIDLPLHDELDQRILMQRDAHFGGVWAPMILYYESEGLGCDEEISLDRIERLAILERELGQDLLPVLCTEDQISRIAQSHELYRQIRSLYAIHEPEARLPQMISDLILAEEEELPKIIQAIIHEGAPMTPLLIELLNRPELLDPLFPGYGQGPGRAAHALGMIADPRAVVPLFEFLIQLSLNPEAHFESEEAALTALRHIGQPAEEFLLHILRRRPIGHDHLTAAMALCEFPPNEEIQQAASDLAKEVSPSSTLGEYLQVLLENS